MSSKILSAAVLGLDCELIEVEADTFRSLPGISIVGLPDKSVDESRERVRSAIKNSELQVPRNRVTINLAPADIKKVGPAYDLPIAISILSVSNQIKAIDWQNQIYIGELALDGSLRPINGVLSVCLKAVETGIKNIFLPKQNAAEASLVKGLNIFPCEKLSQLVAFLNSKTNIEMYSHDQNIFKQVESNSELDMAFINGQSHAKRALEIAAAGGHNILMSGPPGSGKTLLAKTATTILPEMNMQESLEVTRIYSVAGLLPLEKPLLSQRPFRNPHHTASSVALVGGGSWPKPGEISLAHRGILFLDELPEFPRLVLENLRQPLEDGVVSVSRASGTLQFPAAFILIAAMNPCPCGYLSDPDRQCVCSPSNIVKYQNKISGPLLDRIDLHLEVPKVKIEKLTSKNLSEPSLKIRQRVQAARQIQKVRFNNFKIITNSEMSSRQVKDFCQVDDQTSELLRQAVRQFNLSARSYFRILKISRTIADLEGSKNITIKNVAESLQYRPKVE